MSCYIASADNRFYTILEPSLGTVPEIAAANRIPAVKLLARQRSLAAERHDKTGTRSFPGLPPGVRKDTRFELKTYLTAWSEQAAPPSYGPLFEAALGAAPLLYAGGTIASVQNGTRVQFSGAHGLEVGQAIAAGGELRFVAAVVDASTVDVNAPLSSALAGAPAGATVTYKLARDLNTVSIFDYWSPETMIQRVLCGAAVNDMKFAVNSDFHEFTFGGPARDILDSRTFTEGEGGMANFPAEPEVGPFDYTIVPGHLGQVWLGSTPDRFYTLTEAELSLDNQIDVRNREFGIDGIRCIAAGVRKVQVNFELYASDAERNQELYEAARLRSPVKAMLQLGDRPGQLFGAYLKSVVPEMPDFDDAETRLQWKFGSCRAHGTADDELVLAFG